jgi:dihydrofolate reductase
VSRVRYYLAQSLDGYIADRDGRIDWLQRYDGTTDVPGAVPMAGTYDEFLSGIGALAMGSATYEFLLGLDRWPYDDMPAWVFSTRALATMEGADVRFVSGPVRPPFEQMIAAAGERDVWLIGGGVLAASFASEGLLDELIVTVVPVVLGDGIPTFCARLAKPLALTSSRTYTNGMVELRYDVSH